MFQHRSCAIALAVPLVALSPAQADDVLTLACQGTIEVDAKPEPVSMSVVVNFTTRTVEGFTDPLVGALPAHLSAVTEGTIIFGNASDPGGAADYSIYGSIDRITGDVWAESWVLKPKIPGRIGWMRYTLKCRPAQRMF